MRLCEFMLCCVRLYMVVSILCEYCLCEYCLCEAA